MTLLSQPARAHFRATTTFSKRVSATRAQAALGAAGAAAIAGAGMLLLRAVLQVRSVPERLMEWLLLFVPPALFDALLQRLGFDTKRYALIISVALVFGCMGWFGYVVLRRGWPVPALAGVGVGLWLVVMLVVMPLTSAGVFGVDLRDGTAGAVGGNLAVGLSFAAVLAWQRVRLVRRAAARRAAWREDALHMDAPAGVGSAWQPPVRRRAALTLVGGAAVTYAATYLAVRKHVVLGDPRAPAASTGPEANFVGASAPMLRASSRGPLPEPATVRDLRRDKDGAVLPSGRNPGELAAAVTSNEDFYVVTKNAGGDPVIHPTDWRLPVDGAVEGPLQLDYAALRDLPAVEVTKTLECISNLVGKPELAPFGAELIGTAVWRGVRVRDVLELAGGTKSDAAWVAVLGADEYSSALPLEVAMDPATLLVYEMNGQVLPREHGYPARLLVPNRYGLKNTKWVVGLRVMTREFTDWYGQRNWTKQAIVRTMVRIDTPAPGARLQASAPSLFGAARDARGRHTIAGIAYAGSRGISRVEYSADSGKTWQDAQLMDAAPLGSDQWVRWTGTFSMPSRGPLALIARATDGAGELQMEAFSLPEPDGGTGWMRVEVSPA